MIEQCILDVYLRDKKVFLPEFGAIIYSDFDDSIDFNDILTFDDGKVVEEIQKQQSIPEEEARKLLEEYVQGIKDTLGKGKLHYFTGIGYLSKDDHGNYSIEKSKPSTKPVEKKSSETKSTKPTKKKAAEAEKKQEEPAVKATSEIEPEQPPEIPADEEKIDIELEPQENDFLGEETEFEVEEKDTFSSFTSDDDSYQEYEDEPSYGKKNNSTKKILWIALFVIILSVGGFYLISIFFLSDSSEKKELLSSNNQQPEETIAQPEQVSEESNEIAEESALSDQPENVESVASTSSGDTSLSEEDDDEKKTFSLIFAGFKEEKNAGKYLRKLKQQGYDVEIFPGLHQMHFVGIKKIYSKSNAVKQLEQIRQKESQAWIYNYDLLPKK